MIALAAPADAAPGPPTQGEEEGKGKGEGSSFQVFTLISATFRDKTYSGGTVLVDSERGEIEFRQMLGRWGRKHEAVTARFHVEQDAEIRVDGAILRVSELSMSLESPEQATEVARLLGRPARAREMGRVLADAEASIRALLEAREKAMDFLSRARTDPRAAMLSEASMWTEETREPLDAISSSYSTRIAESLERTRSLLASGAEDELGPNVTNRLYALAYTIGAVQNAIFEQDEWSLTQELAALQELGIAATVEDLKMERLAHRLMLRAHPALEALIIASLPPPPGAPSSAQ